LSSVAGVGFDRRNGPRAVALDRKRRRDGFALVLVVIAAGFGASGCGGMRARGDTNRPAPTGAVHGSSHTSPSSHPRAAPTQGGTLAEQSATLAALRARRETVPVRLELPGSIDASVLPVGIDPSTGDLAVPPSASTVAWYETGPVPGAAGAAVLAGHVDWHGQRGVFFGLNRVPVGAPVTVTLSNGRQMRFTVVRRTEVSKNDLGGSKVFSDKGPPQLVLITCGGDFDWQTHHYADNVIVYARPIT
jgi:hypothetical protein